MSVNKHNLSLSRSPFPVPVVAVSPQDATTKQSGQIPGFVDFDSLCLFPVPPARFGRT